MLWIVLGLLLLGPLRKRDAYRLSVIPPYDLHVGVQREGSYGLISKE